jgi:5-methylcytosine-specific restriction endonuclease McrA
MDNSVMSKRCPRCGDTKPSEEYGKSWACKPCHSAYVRRLQRASPDKKRAADRAWREANPGWSEWHKEHGREAAQRRRAREREAFVEDVSLRVLFERDEGICQLCLEPVDWYLRERDPLSQSIDHIVPISLGGEHSYANTQLAHLICNIRKRDRVEEPLLSFKEEGQGAGCSVAATRSPGTATAIASPTP